MINIGGHYMNRKKLNKLIGKIKRQIKQPDPDKIITVNLTKADMMYLLSDRYAYIDFVNYLKKNLYDPHFEMLYNFIKER